MQIIVNSDVFYPTKLYPSGARLGILSKGIRQLTEECARTGVKIMIPRVALLELERKYSILMEKEITYLTEIKVVIDDYGVNCIDFDPKSIVTLPDIIKSMQDIGANVEVLDPTLADFVDAQRRAAGHLPPSEPEKKSDEMRDLVIWVMACRVAKSNMGTFLLSNDIVHWGPLGKDEARQSGLTRVRTVEVVLDALGLGSSSAKKVMELMQPLWPNLVRHGLPFAERFTPERILTARFVAGKESTSEARFHLSMITDDEKKFESNVELIYLDEAVHVMLNDIKIDGAIWEDGHIDVSITRPKIAESQGYSEKLAAIRAILGEEDES
jgi:hypothetical protein